MKERKCQKENCEKRAISFSDFCGEHSNSEEIVKALNELNGQTYDHLFLKDINLEGINLRDVEFNYPNLMEVEIESSEFHHCQFNVAGFINVHIEESTFDECLFEEAVEILSSHFSNCQIIHTLFKEANISQSAFQENTKIEECLFENCNLVGTILDSSMMLNSVINLSQLNQSSINQSVFDGVKIQNSDIYKTTFWDCKLSNCDFIKIQNDFDELEDSIELSLLNNTTFEDTFIPDRLARWNGINETNYEFYSRVIKQVWETSANQDLEYIDNLSALVTAVTNLDQDTEPDLRVKGHITNIFSKFFNLAKEKQDLGSFSKIAQYLSKIPKNWITDLNNFLPSPDYLIEESRLKLVFNTNDLSFEKASKIFTKLHQLESSFPNHSKSVIKELNVGSIVIEISNSIEIIVLFIYALNNGANLYLDFQKKIRENEKLRLEIEEKQNKEPSELESLEIEKMKEEIKLLKLQQFELLKNQTGVEPTKLLSEPEQELVLNWGQAILDEADTLDLYAQILQENVREA